MHEDKEKNKKLASLRVKGVSFILVIVLVLFFAYHFSKQNKIASFHSSLTSLPSLPHINIQPQFAATQKSVVLGAQTEAQKLASQAAHTASTYIISVMTKPIVDKINTLPTAQKEEIKQQICK